MNQKSAEKTRNKTAKIYALGILAFSAFFGFITVLYIFLANLKLD
jgi:hypothetical protein